MAAEHKAQAGLPQMDVAFYAGQLFWLVFIFALLYVLLSRVAMPAVESTQMRRRHIIDGELAAATAAHEAAKASAAGYEHALAAARAKAQTTIAEISVEAARVAAAQQAEQNAALVKQLQSAETALHAAKEKARKEVSGLARDIALALINKVRPS